MISIKTSIVDKKDPNLDRILKELKKAQNSYVTVGFHEGAGSYDDGQSVITVAIWNEFGNEVIPERSFLRTAIDGNIEKINEWIYEGFTKIIQEGWTTEKVLGMIGFRVRVLIQNKIGSDVPPPNAPSTVAEKARKGIAQRTLIDSGLMRRSVEYKVVMK